MTAKTENNHIGSLKKNSLIQAWLVLLLAVGFGVSLAGVQLTLGPKIESNKINETRERIPLLVLGKSLAGKMAAENQTLTIEPRQVAVELTGKTKYYRIYETRYQGKLRGWVVKTKGQGYADSIELLLGLSPDFDAITGLYILDQKETPGLGNKIVTESWRKQFIQKPTVSSLRVVKTGAGTAEEINAITGATISSKSVTGLVNAAIRDLRQPLSAIPSTAGKEEKSNG